MSKEEGRTGGEVSSVPELSPSLLRAMLDQSEHFMALLDLDGNVVDVNQTALALAGLEADAVRGKPFWETPWWAHSAELARLVKEAIRQALAGDTVRFIALSDLLS